jgi:protoheme IX farnesyltransferase|tara:strand:- start:176 stop:982 length:807 start_codon:yes stop_codon:yes gene_type:complete
LVFTALGGVIFASGRPIPWITLLIVGISVTLGSAGANTLTSYFDRDIDLIMNRTKARPIPSKRIYPSSKALYFGLILSFLSIIISYYFINLLAAALMIFGLFDNVIVYSKILKRRHPISIILGGFSGGTPVLIGYASITNTIDFTSIILASLVVIWIPSHIWSLALHSKEDYKKANVPMLPVIISEKASVQYIALTSFLLVIFSLLLILFYPMGIIYQITVILTGIIMVILNIWLLQKPNEDRAWIVFKYSSPYLALIFLSLIIDSLL